VHIVLLEFFGFQEHLLQERRQQHLVAETLHRHERLHRLVNDSTAAAHAELNLDCLARNSRIRSGRFWMKFLHRAENRKLRKKLDLVLCSIDSLRAIIVFIFGSAP
jgi:hypothetical protein